jgi:hypothetical protein
MPIKFIKSDVRISFVSYLAFKRPGIIPHAAPKRKLEIIISGICIAGGNPDKKRPAMAVPAAPMKSCPSAPIFQTPLLKATMYAKEQNNSGAASFNERPILRRLPKPPDKESQKTSPIEYPEKYINIEVSPKAMIIAIKNDRIL